MTSVKTQAGEGVESADASKDFAHLEDRGGTLFVRVKRIDGEGSVPVVITRA
ncbi:hypothetical protein M0765_013965 [Variovorax sp. S2]|uniref:hypothetical protein n=1 Tax=Variovorax sp. S12S4 TaxID=3029170 RepID=UPI00215C77AD|nr:hypothetical protein [Variovorax sp. S12S4]MCR8958793.1 hypothetical protein [Variovorax sp. S12S4]